MKTLGTVRFPCILDLDQRLNESTKIQWYFNDTIINTPEDHQLVLDQVTKKHEGSYTCKVNSYFGSINMTARLTVLAEPPSFTATGNVHNGYNGHKVQNVHAVYSMIECDNNGNFLLLFTELAKWLLCSHFTRTHCIGYERGNF